MEITKAANKTTPHQGVDQALRSLARDEGVTLVIAGNCMTPVLCDGDSVAVTGGRCWPGDILVFRNHSGQLTAHRMLGVYRRQGQWRYIARADDRSKADAAVPANHVIGRVSHIRGQAPLSVSAAARWRCLQAFAALIWRRLMAP